MIQFILNEPTQFLLMKPQEIADTTFVSKSTLYRLLDKLGYSGLTEFKIDFAAAIQPKNNQNLNLDVDYPIKESDSLREISENLSDLYQETIHETLQHFDYRQITEIIDIMLNAKSITIFTTSSNLCFPGNFAFQMKEIGYPVNVPKDEYNQSLYAASANQDDVAIIISYQGRSKILHHVADTLHAQDIKTILITSVHDHEIKNKVKYCLYLASNENHYNKISSFLLGFHSFTS